MNSNFAMVQVDGRAFCAGLFWYPLDGASGTPNQLETLLAEQQAAFFATRGHPATQVGLVDAEASAQRGALSIAACVADQLTREGLRSFLVALPTDTPELWCYVAQNQELIQFDGDLVGTADEVLARMNEHLAASVDWELVVAPAEWAVPAAVQRERLELVPQGRLLSSQADARLRPVHRRGQASGAPEGLGVVTLACVLLLMAECGAGYWVWRHVGGALEAQQSRASLEQQAFVAQRPWLHKPDLAQWAPLCVRAVAQRSMDLAGWTVSRIACDPVAASVRIEWTRGNGALFDALAQLRPAARLAGATKEPATAWEVVRLAPPRETRLPVAPSELLGRATWQREVSRWSEQWREQRPLFASTASGQDGGAIPWSLTGSMPPEGQIRSLTLPGSVLSGIEFTHQGGKAVWTVKATHYVQN